jgi:signal transduction histidine kinase
MENKTEKNNSPEQVIKELQNELEQIKCSSNQCKQSINIIMGNLSHELRTPLNGIVGFSELLSTTKLTPDEVKLYAGVIDESSMMLMSILNDVMEIVRIQTGNYPANIEPFDLNDLLFNVFMEFRDKAEEKGLQLFLENLVSETYIIASSNDIIKRVLEKLIDNAIKFTREGWIKISYQKNGNGIEFKVEDTGIGIAEANRENLFSKFICEEVSKSRKVSGTGLDLTLCSGLVGLLGGTIDYEPARDQGSVFKFSIVNHYDK